MSDAIEETASPVANGAAVDQVAAEAARAELAARAEKLRASGWDDEPAEDWPSWLLTKDVATDEQRASHREELRRRHEAAKARAEEVLGRGRQREERDALVYKTHVNTRPEPCIPESSSVVSSEATMEKILLTGFDAQQAATLNRVVDHVVTIIAEETAFNERALRNEIKARFLELENQMLRAQLGKSGDRDVIDFDVAKATVRRNAG